MGEKYKSVFDAISDTPQEALNMKFRSRLMNEIIDQVNSNGWRHEEAAKHLGVSQSKVSDLFRGKLSKFSLDTLFNMLASIAHHLKIKIKAD